MFYGVHLPPSGQRVRLRMNYRQHVNYTYIAQLEMKEISETTLNTRKNLYVFYRSTDKILDLADKGQTLKIPCQC